MYLNIFGYQVPLYGIFFYIGIFVAALVALLMAKRKNLEKFDIAGSGVYTMIGAIIGSKLLFLIVSWEDIVAYKIFYEVSWYEMMLSVIKGGFVFYGGLMGGLLGLLIYIKQFKMSFGDFADIYAMVLPLGHAFGRIGCFFAGCCYGIPYDGIFSYTYTETVGLTPLGVPLLPIQLIEAASLFVLFAVLIVSFLHYNRKYRCVIIYSVSYAIIRFVLEFFRGDVERGVLLQLSTSQWISIVILGIVVCKICYSKIRNRH